ncbi:PIN2/TERF1-interacting telomerase inhibitor 1 [Electrophorus electricus]|uniref:G-patch domain-containing protein n=1 Tax=Electrophorus electricus TaxID=8005 RepID=A0A4W4F5P9_ELEEL|nr:PIN2/TERF1-interacting telomerase inhibitor 1 [Electrophorus electricus]
MSMLAEPRRKQKWSVDPRNSAWSKDESKFGQKMLERMGWSKGKGLGKSEQGATEHIKVKVKNNNMGLGTTVYNEDNWIAHQEDFNQLLAELNNCHRQNPEEPTQEEMQGFSLEKKSKTSKKRVHYMKFTKGKDLSNRSETDLACIFGKRLKQTSNQDESSNGCDSQEEKEQDSSEQDQPAHPEMELSTVTSTLTMQEYFAQRMARLKTGCGKSLSAASSPGNTPASTEPSPNHSDMEERNEKKKKKKKKKKEVTEEVVDEKQGDLERRKKKKKKKNKQGVREFGIPTAGEDTGDVEALSPDKRKSKRKDKGTTSRTPPDSANEHNAAGIVMDREYSDKKCEKRKRREQVEEQAEVVVEEKKPKTAKKKDH